MHGVTVAFVNYKCIELLVYETSLIDTVGSLDQVPTSHRVDTLFLIHDCYCMFPGCMKA